VGVWDHLGDLGLLSRLLAHPAKPAVTAGIAQLLSAVRSTEDRSHPRGIQVDLFGYLRDAEARYAPAQRLSKRQEQSELEAIYWRRVCVQLRTVGDAIAWKLLEA